MEITSQTDKQPTEFQQRQFTRIFENIDDEITIQTANAKYNYTTCKTDQKTLQITLAYIDDTKKLVNLLKNRMSLIMKQTKI
jgi:hypothetical protein